MKKIKVKVEFIIEVEIPDNDDYNPYFDIEENHCAGTGIVGSTLESLISYHDKNDTCWACSLEESKCTIVE